MVNIQYDNTYATNCISLARNPYPSYSLIGNMWEAFGTIPLQGVSPWICSSGHFYGVYAADSEFLGRTTACFAARETNINDLQLHCRYLKLQRAIYVFSITLKS